MSSLDPPALDLEPPRVPALLLRKPEAAAALGIGVRTLDKLVEDGHIEPLRRARRGEPRSKGSQAIPRPSTGTSPVLTSTAQSPKV